MPDSWLVRGFYSGGLSDNPGPTQLELASYCIAEEGIDFDFGSLFQNTYVENAANDGGAFGFRRSGIRRFNFPLRLASSWPGPGGLSGLTEYLRRLVTTPNHASAGYIDLLPENASYAIRFDILDARLNLRNYSVYRQRIARHDYDLTLDVQPFGYMPTKIILASQPGASGFLELQWSPASVIGDVPGLAEIAVFASTLPSSNPAGLAVLDGLYWSLARHGGTNLPNGYQLGTVMVSPSSLAAATSTGASRIWGATHQADAFSPVGMALRIGVNASLGASGFQQIAVLNKTFDNNEARYMGRFRILAYARTTPSVGLPIELTADVSNAAARAILPLASQNTIATVLPQNSPSWATNGSAYQIFDFGEHSLPPAVSSGVGGFAVRLWAAQVATSDMTVPTMLIDVGALALLPVGGDAGIVARGMVIPTIGYVTFSQLAKRFTINSIRRSAYFGDGAQASLYNQTGLELADARPFHTGPYPVVSTSNNLVVIPFARTMAVGATAGITHQPMALAASVTYRPRFAFLRGV